MNSSCPDIILSDNRERLQLDTYETVLIRPSPQASAVGGDTDRLNGGAQLQYTSAGFFVYLQLKIQAIFRCVPCHGTVYRRISVHQWAAISVNPPSADDHESFRCLVLPDGQCCGIGDVILHGEKRCLIIPKDDGIEALQPSTVTP